MLEPCPVPVVLGKQSIAVLDGGLGQSVALRVVGAGRVVDDVQPLAVVVERPSVAGSGIRYDLKRITKTDKTSDTSVS